MFYEDLKVPIPKKKRIRRGTNYVYEILARKSKTCPKDIVMCVGKAIDDIYMIPNEKYYEIHKETDIPEPRQQTLLQDTTLNIGAYLLIKNMVIKEGLYDCIKETFGEATDLILSYIVYSLVYQDTDPKLHKFFAFNHYSGINYVPNDIKLMQYFNRLMDGEHTYKFIKSWLNKRLLKSKDKPLKLDYSSYSFLDNPKVYYFNKKEDNKDNETLLRYSVNYLLEKDTGIPIYYDIYYGSTLNLYHGSHIIRKIKEIKDDIDVEMVLDKDYFTSKNIDLLMTHNIKYFVLSDKNKFYKNVIKKYPKEEINKEDNKIFSLIYGVKLNINDELMDQFNINSSYKFYLYLNETYVRETINKELETIRAVSRMFIGQKDYDNMIKNEYGKVIKLELDSNKVITSATPNMRAINKYHDKLGYSLFISNVDENPKDIYASFRHKEVFQDTFKIGLELSKPLRRCPKISLASNVKGIFGYMTAITRSIIIYHIQDFIYQFPNESSQTILLEVDKIRVNKVNNKYILQYALNKKQKEILKYFGLEYRDVLKVVNEINQTLTQNKDSN